MSQTAFAEEISRRDELVFHPGWCRSRTTPCEGYHAGPELQVEDTETPEHTLGVAPLHEQHGIAPGGWGIEVTIGGQDGADGVIVISCDSATQLISHLTRTIQQVRDAERAHRAFPEGAPSFRAGVNRAARVAGQGQPNRLGDWASLQRGG
jgi:hypothetical protein